MATKIRKGDKVVVISGKDRGVTGEVQRVYPREDRVIVAGVNIIKRHQRPTAANPQAESGVIEREASIHISNVMLVDPTTGKRTRIGISREDGVRRRIARGSGNKLD